MGRHCGRMLSVFNPWKMAQNTARSTPNRPVLQLVDQQLYHRHLGWNHSFAHFFAAFIPPTSTNIDPTTATRRLLPASSTTDAATASDTATSATSEMPASYVSSDAPTSTESASPTATNILSSIISGSLIPLRTTSSQFERQGELVASAAAPKGRVLPELLPDSHSLPSTQFSPPFLSAESEVYTASSTRLPTRSALTRFPVLINLAFAGVTTETARLSAHDSSVASTTRRLALEFSDSSSVADEAVNRVLRTTAFLSQHAQFSAPFPWSINNVPATETWTHAATPAGDFESLQSGRDGDATSLATRKPTKRPCTITATDFDSPAGNRQPTRRTPSTRRSAQDGILVARSSLSEFSTDSPGVFAPAERTIESSRSTSFTATSPMRLDPLLRARHQL
ncbi:hypothetical protein BDZ89DRAFT_1156268 [Hymenopellis radicata]|nr:hypothetical protein BDZ89DRAFT_1156268 [Hymenopellis radicata]